MNIKFIFEKLTVFYRMKKNNFKELNSAHHYQFLHDQFSPYQVNNWMLEHTDFLISQGYKTLIEFGCGNGKFLRSVSDSFDFLHGIDWARSSQHENNPKNVFFHQLDISKDLIPLEPVDLAISADFLEHLPPDLLNEAMVKIHNSASNHFHVIACYDDGGTHFSLHTPEKWSRLFKKISRHYYIKQVINRNGREVVVITDII